MNEREEREDASALPQLCGLAAALLAAALLPYTPLRSLPELARLLVFGAVWLLVQLGVQASRRAA